MTELFRKALPTTMYFQINTFQPETVESYNTMLVSTACCTECQLRVMRACSLVPLRLSLSIGYACPSICVI
ncbi:hypothetical protein JMJ77_0008893 [Colletotrichum scovillei]|uniref:Uncharacterized protein n=1 Tax=Colletotrichum scovillei TaxID=1209932 RepID=A0A9P7QS23_9PEZI|nr:hypothetical protein JMJ78_0001750 [Colletotrichum scovillei]KAG7041189.1 hypothetical protein JMJ77_0008893 [Colletotrichum scovillei]KAG7061221.1 hypothetical protein JMJ76_0010290 [Colletotrichum scovillei]